MNTNIIVNELLNNDSQEMQRLFMQADSLRREHVGDQVHLRGLIEISNNCRRNCLYCGIRSENRNVERYRLSKAEILGAAQKAVDFQYGSVVLQAGEDGGIETDWMADIIREIKKLGLAITLSLGERDDEDFRIWHKAGADRYLLRFETSNPHLFAVIHPPIPNQKPVDRIAMLHRLRSFGYEIGSGVMIGIPGQTFLDLAQDIALFRTIPLDMIGCGPFLPHPQTPLGQAATSSQTEGHKKYGLPEISPEDQVLATAEMAFKVIALARITCPKANIPCTTAVATIDAREGRKLGLQRGANVVMPNLTPVKYRKLYEIYPNKAATYLTAEQTHESVLQSLQEIGRIPGKGRGDSAAMQERRRSSSS